MRMDMRKSRVFMQFEATQEGVHASEKEAVRWVCDSCDSFFAVPPTP